LYKKKLAQESKSFIIIIIIITVVIIAKLPLFAVCCKVNFMGLAVGHIKSDD